jgi:hypothetical protein
MSLLSASRTYRHTERERGGGGGEIRAIGLRTWICTPNFSATLQSHPRGGTIRFTSGSQLITGAAPLSLIYFLIVSHQPCCACAPVRTRLPATVTFPSLPVMGACLQPIPVDTYLLLHILSFFSVLHIAVMSHHVVFKAATPAPLDTRHLLPGQLCTAT